MGQYELGLVLSGGGMSCAAHIGALTVFEENNIYPSIISGTSGGAIVGALLANGVPCNKMLEVFKKANLFSFYHFARKKAGLFDIESYNLLEPYFPEDSFEALNIPLIINATQLRKGETVYFSKGKLIKKLFASSAFPGLFAPVTIENQLYADGGILENLPTRIIRKKCKKLIAINVNVAPELELGEMSNSLDVVSRALRLSISCQQSFQPNDCDLIITPEEVANHFIFSKDAIDAFYEIGYKEAKKNITALKKLIQQTK